VRQFLLSALATALVGLFFLGGNRHALAQTGVIMPPTTGGFAGLTTTAADLLYCRLAGCTMTGGTTYSGVATDITTGTNETLVVDTNGTGVVQLNDQLVMNGITDDITTGTNEALRIIPNGTGALTLRSGSSVVTLERGLGTSMLQFDLNSGVALKSVNANGAVLLAATGVVGAYTDIGATAAAGIVGDTFTTLTGGTWVSLMTVLGEGLLAISKQQAITCVANAGAGGVLGGVTVTPTSSVAYVTNPDSDGCIVTLGETSYTTLQVGSDVEIVVVSNAGGFVTFPAVANVHAGPTFATTTGLDTNDSYRIHYTDKADDMWVGVTTSNN
jgi:hypothetical protein